MRISPVILLVVGLFAVGAGLIWPAAGWEEKRFEVASAPAEQEELVPFRRRIVGGYVRTSPQQVLYDQLTDSLRSARYAFNHPDVMYLTKRSQITLTLAEEKSGALAALRQQFEQQPEGAVMTGETKYAPVMVAVLRGKDFKIEPFGAQERTVLLKVAGPTEWTWIVEPLETGASKLLVLELSARLARGGENLPPLLIKTLEARINVDVQPWDRVLIQARRMTPVAQAFTGVGGLIALVGFVGTTRRWLKGEKKN